MNYAGGGVLVIRVNGLGANGSGVDGRKPGGFKVGCS